MPSAVLSWTASPSASVTGYKIHQSAAPGGPYTDPGSGFPINVGNVLTYTLASLVYETDYYLVVTAYTATGAESAPSNEVYIRIANPIPAPPSGLTATY